VLVREPIITGPRVDPFVRRVGRDQVLGFEQGSELGQCLLLCCVAAGRKELAPVGVVFGAQGVLTGDRGGRQGDLVRQTWCIVWY
jgi:hypothetical protein